MSAAARHTALSALLQPDITVPAGADPVVAGLTVDSRQVRQGWVFAACQGTDRHGLEFVPDAIKAGAAAILWEPAATITADEARSRCRAAGVPLVAVPELSRRLGRIAALLHREPSKDLSVVGVTGTDGKTSVSQFLAQALASDGQSCGLIGTLGYGMWGSLVAGSNTTPDAARVQALLAEFRDQGARFASMEVSSHALDQHRVAGVRFHTAVLTNLGRDHLDYHMTEQDYADAKRRLFEQPGLGCAVLNLDDDFGRTIRSQLAAGIRVLGYSLSDGAAEISVSSLRFTPDSLLLEAASPAGNIAAEVPVMGRFNAQNLLAVSGVLVSLGWDAARIGSALAGLHPVPGRMECFGGGDRPLVVVDYAHTPGALAAALQALAEHNPGRIWCVFGCGGERDPGKRPLMAKVAEAHAQHVIVTDDNPRRESPEQIIADIQSGFRLHQATVVRDREAAIAQAMNEAGPGDAVLVAGKGHEDYQITADGIRHYSDRETVMAVLGEVRS